MSVAAAVTQFPQNPGAPSHWFLIFIRVYVGNTGNPPQAPQHHQPHTPMQSGSVSLFRALAHALAYTHDPQKAAQQQSFPSQLVAGPTEPSHIALGLRAGCVHIQAAPLAFRRHVCSVRTAG